MSTTVTNSLNNNLSDGSYASAVILYGMNQPYTIIDTAPVLAGAQSAVLNGALSVTVSSVTASAADLLAADALTGKVINVGAVTTVTGTLAQLQALYPSSGTTGLGNETLLVSDSVVYAAAANSVASFGTCTLDLSAATTVIGTGAAVYATYHRPNVIGLGNETITLTDTTLNVGNLTTLDSATSGVVQAGSIVQLSGYAWNLLDLYATNAAGSAFSGLGDEKLLLSDQYLDAANLPKLETATTGAIDASAVKSLFGSVADIAAAESDPRVIGMGDVNIGVTDTSVSADALNILDSQNKGVVDASYAGTITGSVAALMTLFGASAAGTVSGLGNDTLVLSDYSLSTKELTLLSQVNNDYIDASALAILSGPASELFALYSNPAIFGLSNCNMYVTDSTLDEAMLINLRSMNVASTNVGDVGLITGSAVGLLDLVVNHGNVGGLPFVPLKLVDVNVQAFDAMQLSWYLQSTLDMTSVVSLTGKIVDLATIHANVNIIGLGHQNFMLDETSVPASAVTSMDALTTGIVDASMINYLNGTLDQLLAAEAYTPGVIGLGNEELYPNDPVLAATKLLALDARTSGAIWAGGTATTITGTTTALQAVYDANAAGSIVGLSLQTATASNTSLFEADLKSLIAISSDSGKVDVSAATVVVATSATILAAYTNAKFIGLGNETIGLTDQLVPATTLSTIDAKNSGTIDASAVLTITGSASAVLAAYAGVTSGGLSGLGNEAIKLADTTLAAASLTAVDGKSTSVVDAASVTTLTGTSAEIAAVFAEQASGGISGLGNELLIVSDTSVAAANLNALDSLSSGVLNAASVVTITGDQAAIQALYNAGSAGAVSGLGNEIVQFSDQLLSANSLRALDLNTTGVVNASALVLVSGLASDMQKIYTSAGIGGLGNESIVLSDVNIAASTLIMVDNFTSAGVNAFAVNQLSGSVSELLTVYAENSNGAVTGLGNELVSVTNVPTVSQIQAIDAATTGLVSYGAVHATTGADVFNLNSAGFSIGSRILDYAAGNQAGSAWFTNVAGAGLATGDTFTINGAMDVIGFLHGDALDLSAFHLAGQSSPAQFGATGSKVGDGEYALVRGTLAGSIFTDSAAGNALLVVWDGNTAAGSVTQVAVVLTGVTSLLVGYELVL